MSNNEMIRQAANMIETAEKSAITVTGINFDDDSLAACQLPMADIFVDVNGVKLCFQAGTDGEVVFPGTEAEDQHSFKGVSFSSYDLTESESLNEMIEAAKVLAQKAYDEKAEPKEPSPEESDRAELDLEDLALAGGYDDLADKIARHINEHYPATSEDDYARVVQEIRQEWIGERLRGE